MHSFLSMAALAVSLSVSPASVAQDVASCDPSACTVEKAATCTLSRASFCESKASCPLPCAGSATAATAVKASVDDVE